VRFAVPFISYESDMFAVFGGWRTVAPPLASANEGIEDGWLIDPFSGLQRSKIRRVGLSESPHGEEAAVEALDAQNLPALEEFLFLTLPPGACDYSPEALASHHLREADFPNLQGVVEDL
jgi:hypothetical protein